MKWWEIVPVGSTLVGLSTTSGIAVFECDDDGNDVHGERWTVDLFTDEVLS